MGLQTRKLLYSALVSLLLLANAFVLERLISQQTWSLFDLRNEFLVTKRLLQMPVIGSSFFLRGRAAIAQGEVHLNRWLGYQEIRTTKTLALRKIIVSGALHEKGELLIAWKKPDHHSEGLRITSGGSAFFRSDAIGEQTHSEALAMKPVEGYRPSLLTRLSALSRGDELPDRSIEVTLTFSDRKLEVIQGHDKIAVVSPVSGSGIVSVQGNQYPVTVDELTLVGHDGNVITENFEPPVSGKILTALITSAVFLAALLIVLLWIKTEWFRYIATAVYFFFLLSTAIWLADRYHFANLEVEHFGDVLPRTSRLEALLVKAERMRFFWSWEKLKEKNFLEALRKSYPPVQITKGPVLCQASAECTVGFPPGGFPAGKPRLLIVGTSQTAGAGADLLQNTFFVKLHRKLLQKSPDLVSFNIGIPGGMPLGMLEHFRRAVSVFHPDIILINLGHNGSPEDYRKAAELMVRENRARNIFLINEASTDQVQKKLDLSRFNENLAAEHDVKVIRLFQFFHTYDNSRGNVWWDNVHFNNLGHERAAQYLFEEISPHL